MCAKHSWKCIIVYHGTKERFEAEKVNALLVRLSGAECVFVDAKDISTAMDNAMERLKKDGYRPYYIHGGGHDISGGMDLVEAVKQLKKQCIEIGYKPKYILHASGTGSTQAGIAVGLDHVGWGDVKLIGISVARQQERGKQVIVEFANMLSQCYGIVKDYINDINFNTDYLCGGYENCTDSMKEYIEHITTTTGIAFDTTYSGKALYGMMNIVKKQGIKDNILFWHTGGVMNLMK